MEDHQKRVVEEGAELDFKLVKLREFIDSQFFKGLEFGERARLKRQEVAMTEYSEVLAERIQTF